MPAATAADINHTAYIHFNPFLASRLQEVGSTGDEARIRVKGSITDKSNYFDRQFIKLQKSFISQFNEYGDAYQDILFEDARFKFSQSCSALLELRPDVISLELTSDSSILYTIKKDEFVLFAEHFLNEIDVEEEEDEMIVSVYRNSVKLPSYAGSLSSCLIEINNIFEGNRLLVELPLNEVSI